MLPLNLRSGTPHSLRSPLLGRREKSLEADKFIRIRSTLIAHYEVLEVSAILRYLITPCTSK